MRHLLIFLAIAALTACSDAPGGPSDQPTDTDTQLPAIRATDLPAFFDCVRETGGVLIASHRAGPAQGFPENAIETLDYGFSKGIRVFEVDIATSRDGVLFLLHDRSLGRTTSGDGSVADTDWSEISQLSLVDNDNRTTRFHPPKLSDALDWAVENGALLELDKKDTTGWRSVISAVRAAGAENNVLLITYSDRDAGTVQGIAPDIMLTASARGSRDLGKLENLGVDPEMLVAWTGTRAPDKPAWDRLARENVEAAFGTLGRRGERLDDAYWADGDGSEYRAMVRNGLVLLATDAPYRVADALSEDDRGLNACGG